MYEVIFDEEAIDFLNGLQKEQKQRIFNKIISAKDNPFHYFKKFEGRKEYKLRIGDYRAIADIEQETKKIVILTIGHRKNIYQNLT